MTTSANEISAKELMDLYRQGQPIELLDVRSPAEFASEHVAFARNVPLYQLNPLAEAARRSANQPLFVICQRGKRGQMARDAFVAAGVDNVINIEGGTAACQTVGLPMVNGRPAMSIERQVRIVAGLLVLLGVVLGATIYPGFYVLAGLIGAGLTVAGVTDTCLMGNLLARMPWNQRSGKSGGCIHAD